MKWNARFNYISSTRIACQFKLIFCAARTLAKNVYGVHFFPIGPFAITQHHTALSSPGTRIKMFVTRFTHELGAFFSFQLHLSRHFFFIFYFILLLLCDLFFILNIVVWNNLSLNQSQVANAMWCIQIAKLFTFVEPWLYYLWLWLFSLSRIHFYEFVPRQFQTEPMIFTCLTCLSRASIVRYRWCPLARHAK